MVLGAVVRPSLCKGFRDSSLKNLIELDITFCFAALRDAAAARRKGVLLSATGHGGTTL